MDDFLTWLMITAGVVFSLILPYILLAILSEMAGKKAVAHHQIMMNIEDQKVEIKAGEEEIKKAEMQLLKDEANFDPHELTNLQKRVDELLEIRDNLQDENDDLRSSLLAK